MVAPVAVVPPVVAPAGCDAAELELPPCAAASTPPAMAPPAMATMAMIREVWVTGAGSALVCGMVMAAFSPRHDAVTRI